MTFQWYKNPQEIYLRALLRKVSGSGKYREGRNPYLITFITTTPKPHVQTHIRIAVKPAMKNPMTTAPIPMTVAPMTRAGIKREPAVRTITMRHTTTRTIGDLVTWFPSLLIMGRRV